MKAKAVKTKCASPDCENQFVPNRPGKRFCSAKCRIRESVRAMRERQKAATA
jgi:hypothetical protein